MNKLAAEKGLETLVELLFMLATTGIIGVAPNTFARLPMDVARLPRRITMRMSADWRPSASCVTKSWPKSYGTRKSA